MMRAETMAAGGAALLSAAAPAPHPERLAALVGELEAQEAKRSKFSRRRAVDEDVGGGAFINEPNRAYVTSLAKATDKYTVGIKQALERGTAM